MSSYYFGDDSDQGPPQTSPGCGNEWVCEHRWKSIGKFHQFCNYVYTNFSTKMNVDIHVTNIVNSSTKE